MKIIEPKVEYWKQENNIAHVARCARVCYGKETGNDDLTVANLIKKKHLSMFRHETIYIVAPYEKSVAKELFRLNYCPYVDYFYNNKYIFISTNGQFIRECGFMNNFNNYIVDEDTFLSIDRIAATMRRFTFKITTQISTSRELNRVSPNNIAEKSTRYVYENGTICRPHWMSKEESEEYNNNHLAVLSTNARNYVNVCSNSFGAYEDMINFGNMHRQDARGVLPLDTATECIYTYSWREWEEIIRKRVYNITGKAHPNATIICKLIEQELNSLGYDVGI